MDVSYAPLWAFLGSVLGGAIGAYLNNHLIRHSEELNMYRQKAAQIISYINELNDLMIDMAVAVQGAALYGDPGKYLDFHGIGTPNEKRKLEISNLIGALIELYFPNADSIRMSYAAAQNQYNHKIIDGLRMVKKGTRNPDKIWPNGIDKIHPELFSLSTQLSMKVISEVRSFEGHRLGQGLKDYFAWYRGD